MYEHENIRMYEVGGCVRDELLGLQTKDVDYTVVAPSFSAMRDHLNELGFEIFLETPQYLTIRARFPRNLETFGGRQVKGLTADFVLARKDGEYTDGRRPDEVTPGTLFDDLARRDFTVNAMAKDSNGEIIDVYDGQRDLKYRWLRAVGDPMERMSEDPLRILRALRFSITKDFDIAESLWDVMTSTSLVGPLTQVSVERRREELLRAFKHDTLATLELLQELPTATRAAIFSGGLWLKPTMES
jgi:tRNA nucleotidyltransferase/poly(A) polymerase